MKKLTVLVSLVGLMLVVSLSNLLAGVAFGQTATDTVALDVQAVQQAESITTSDLGVSNPGLLPTNPFYFFKEFSRNVQRVFTFNPVAKAQLEVKIANEKIAEAKKIQETAPNDNNAIIKGVKIYQVAQERVNASLESLKTVASTTPGFEMLMNSVATDVVSHQKVLDEMGIKASDSVDVKNAVDSAKVKIDESAVTAIQDNSTDFANKLQNALVGSKGSDLKHVRSVEIITNIEARAPEAAKPALLKVQENLTNKLNENIQQATEVSGSSTVRRMIQEIPSNDSVQRAVTVKQLEQKIAVPSIRADGGGSAVSVISICDSLKQSLEQLAANVKSGILTEEQYNLKYGFIKKELEQCINKRQPQPTTATPVQKEAPVSNCEFAKCPGESGDLGSIKNSFSNAYWQCYDGAEFKDSSSCKTSEEWQVEAKKFCEGHCYADNSKCGVNSFSVSGECKNEEQVAVPPTTNIAIPLTPVVIEGCGKENEKVNRDPLAGPVTKQCCYGLKEDRSNRLYSVCIRPLESAITNTTNTSVSTGIANPASIFCVSKGYKNVIKSNADGSQYGVCIFNDGSECEEWKFYKGECRDSGSMACPLLAPISPNAALECAEKGGKLISELDSNGCYLTPRCILPSTSSSDIRN